MSKENLDEELKKGKIIIYGDASLRDKFFTKQRDRVVFATREAGS